MTIALSAIRTQLNGIIGDIITGTTNAAGDSDKKSFIDTALAQYPDGYFMGWSAFIPSASESKMVEMFIQPEGVIRVYSAYTTQVNTNTNYELQRFSPDEKKLALNQALYDVYPTFYKRIFDTSLYGQNSYGVSPNEYDKYIYTMPSTFVEFPAQIWKIEGYYGDHTGDDNASALTDEDAAFTVNELIGLTVYNKTDGSSGTVTANTATTITATLSGGTDNDWDKGDEYLIQKPNAMPERVLDYTVIDRANLGSLQFYADINEKYIIRLVGMGQLTQFTTEASTTELTTDQARIVCFKAAGILYRMYSSRANSQDATRFEALAARFEAEYERLAQRKQMPILYDRLGLDWDWSK